MTQEQEDVKKMVNIFVLADIIEQYATELKPVTTQLTKMKVSKLLNASRLLRKDVDLSFTDENVLEFGDIADTLRTQIENILNSKIEVK